MTDVTAEVFCEDRAHEEFIKSLTARVARELGVRCTLNVRSGRGGGPRALREFVTFQRLVLARRMLSPQLIVVAIDANCQRFSSKRKAIEQSVLPEFSDKTVIACPDPHIERWYVADPQSFFSVVGSQPTLGRSKCKRSYYKAVLADAVVDGGGTPTLGGIEYAEEIVSAMDLYRAGRNDAALKSFLDDLRAGMRSSAHP